MICPACGRAIRGRRLIEVETNESWHLGCYDAKRRSEDMAPSSDKRALALADDGFNLDFEEILIDSVAKLMKLGVEKRAILEFLDLMIRVQEQRTRV